MRECIGKIEGIRIGFLEHDGDLLDVVVGADNLQRISMSMGLSMMHRINNASPQANDRYKGDLLDRTHGVNDWKECG